MFGNAPRELWKQWLSPDDMNRIPLATRALLLLLDDGRKILFEVGIGAFFEDKLRDRFGIDSHEHLLLKNLELHGVSDTDIDILVLSHLHFDHVGGIVSAYKNDVAAKLLFPNAQIYTGKKHWERATHPHARDRASFIPEILKLMENSGRLHLVEGASHPHLDFGISFHYSDGHTPGMMLSELHLEGGPLLFVADLIPGMPWVHLPISMGYDRFPEALIDEKTQILKYLVQNKGKAFFTHDPTTPCAAILQNEKGKYYGSELALKTLV